MINVEQVEVSEKMEGPGHFIGELKDHDPHDDDDDDIQTAVFEDGEEDDIGKFMDIMSKKSLMWSKMSMKTMTENEKRYSDVKVLERYRSTIKSLAGQLPPDVQNSTLIIKFILILVAPYAAIIIMASIPMCTPWTHDHGGFYDYVSEDCKQTSYSYYFINMLLIGLIIPSSLAVFEKLCYNKFLSRDMDLSEIFIPLAFALVGSLCFPAILLQWDFVMPFFFMITLFGSYPLLVFGFVAMMWLRWDQFEGISTRRIIKSFMWGQLINSASFLFTFTTYMLYFVLYNYLLKRRSTFSVFGSFMFRFMETFGMTILREINMKEQKLCWTQIDASSIPMGECFVFFVHCTFLSSCRAASAIDKNYLGLVLMSVSDIMGICAATCRLVYRFDPVGILKRKLGFKSHVDDDEAAMGMVGINFIVDKSLYMVVEELIELMVPVIYIFIDITLWFMPNKDLVAGLGNSAFGYTRPTSLEYIPPLILVIVVEFFSFFFLVKVIKAKCQINLWTAMKLFVHTDGRYCIYFALFAFITTNVFRYVPLGCNIHLDFRWRYE